jgi:hypothetical protein
MNVTFTRTAERRYRVSVEGPGVVSSAMDPAAGYDPRLPHDMAHFVVENELGISGGVFGQLAQGGHARTFRPTGEPVKGKVARRGNRIAAANRKDAMLSETVVYLACRVWNNHLSEPPSVDGITIEDVRRVCRTFDAVSAIWSKLGIGESMTLEWRATVNHNRQPRAKQRKNRSATRPLKLNNRFPRRNSS